LGTCSQENPKSNLGRIRLGKISRVQSDLRSVSGKFPKSNLTSDPSRTGCFPTASFGDRSDVRSVSGKFPKSNLTSDPSRTGCFPTASFGDRSDLRSVPKRLRCNHGFETGLSRNHRCQLVYDIFWNLAWHRIGPQPG
jgi:hypothetical protein